MIEPVTLMATLAAKRPAFASEADFQLALGWLIQERHPAARVRLEYRPVYLARRGYGYDVIRIALDRALGEDERDDEGDGVMR